MSHYQIYKNGTFLLATRLDEYLDTAYTTGDVHADFEQIATGLYETYAVLEELQGQPGL